MTSRRLAECVVGREQNELARDVYSLLHLPLVAGVVLVAYGLKSTLHAVDEPLGTVAAAALVGGMGLYLLAHVAMALRSGFTAKPQRLGLGLVLIGLIPVAHRVDAVVTLAGVTVLVWAMVAYETTRFAEVRDDVRHGGRSDLPAE
jgi:low temperature requirement protein LtrA